ncbi:XRE family transcriptional regulator [Actinomadura algeriensis]|uniref:XRE family transcriptional regulator n=1 Tax=Actinomadura algeriensis TaxID=1679523 RepID=A0ABR9JP06_9ACTN|nr:XRE family transcriptional regulator [Actinomadura algeriensis]MBE1532287.1 hypothetical protein [Actinomadura algeriensis]
MTFGAKMCELMTSQNVSLRRLAIMINYDPGYLSKISRDLKPVPEQLAALLDQVLDARGELVALASGVTSTETGKTGELPCIPVGTLNSGPTPDEGDDSVKRRAALQLIAALGAGSAIPPGAVETVLAGVEDALGSDVLDLAEWERVVHDYDYRLRTSPAGTLIEDLTTDIIAMDGLFKRHMPPLQKAGLLRVSSALTGLLAIELGDSGNPRAARVAWGTATRAADASGDQKLRVWVRGRAAEDAVFTQRSPQVVTQLADEAIRIADGTSSPGLLRAQAARAYLAAVEGDREHSLGGLTDSQSTFDRLPGSAAHESVFGYRETQQRWGETFVYAYAGDARADASLSEARSLYPQAALAPRANLALMEAMSLIRNREIGIGLEHAVQTLQGHTRSSAGGYLLSASILSAIPAKARSLPVARELQALTPGAA